MHFEVEVLLRLFKFSTWSCKLHFSFFVVCVFFKLIFDRFFKSESFAKYEPRSQQEWYGVNKTL